MAKVRGAKERKKANTNPLILMRSRPHHLILKSVYIQSKCRVRLKSSMSSRTREHTKKRSWLLLYVCTIVWHTVILDYFKLKEKALSNFAFQTFYIHLHPKQ